MDGTTRVYKSTMRSIACFSQYGACVSHFGLCVSHYHLCVSCYDLCVSHNFYKPTCVFRITTCVFHITRTKCRSPNGHIIDKMVLLTLAKEGAIPGQYVLGEMNKLRGVLPRVVFLRSQVLYIVVGCEVWPGISPIQSAHEAYQQWASMHRRAGYGGAGKGTMARVCRAQAEVRRGPGRP